MSNTQICVNALHSTPVWTDIQDAILELRHRVAEFNACIPYKGIAPSTRLDGAVLQALLSLLPTVSSGFSTPRTNGAMPCVLSSKDAIHLIDLFQCLQRLASSTFVSAAIVNTNGAGFYARL